jgi:cytochrome c oxidase subunit IV
LFLPLIAILVLIALMSIEADYTNLVRHTFFDR